TVKIAGAETEDPAIVAVKDTYYLLVKGVIQTLDLTADKVAPIKIKENFRKNLRAEFEQMFHETWANLQENYYDENFHGRDWHKVKKHYQQFLPFVQSRGDLRTLLSDMLGELNSSHLGFRSQGDEEKTFFKMQTMQTGIIFENGNPYQVHHVAPHSAADKKNIGLQAGDVLVSVNGNMVDAAKNRDAYFTAPSLDAEMTLVFRRGEKKMEIKLHPETTAKFKIRLFDEWIAANQKRVDDTGGGRIAYVYMKDMGDGELQRFLEEMTTEWYRRDALILDLRFNTGGNVHDDVLNFLSRKSYLQWKYRGGRFAPQPNFATAEKPIVLLVNEQSLSDAEMTAAGFKALRLGKVIGTETYRWLIFTSGKTLVDGSFYRLPSWGCFTLEGEDIEMNGVKPDIHVQTTFQDRLQGKDPQLDRAVAEIRQQLAEKTN
ncbi:MAG: PDZ domain-containing protein, partial [Candidatus Aminicenantes bacterium]|nr:PDZ domain-containing protein [Candidatus Aminicenantes bacterium]